MTDKRQMQQLKPEPCHATLLHMEEQMAAHSNTEPRALHQGRVREVH